jgi:c(7)-type cytochrome triheme protein
MLKRSLLTVCFTTLTVLLFASLGIGQPDTLVLKHSGAVGKEERSPVVFPHNRHLESGFSCKDCHHRFEKGQNVLDEGDLVEDNEGIRCSSCHDSQSRVDLREAFHHQCMNCHLKKKQSTGPRFCGQCHRKE